MKKIAAAVALMGLSATVLATDGYFSHGYGMTAKGMGGAATAMTKDTFGGANNPATMVWAGTRLDVGVDWFSPQRSASREGAAGFGLNGSADSGSTDFFIPEFGYNHMLNPNMSLGVTVYGNGGMNTDYSGGQIPAASACAGFNPGRPSYNLLCGNDRLGIDMMQLVIAPTFSMKIAGNHSFGISPLFGYQRFKAEGLEGFAGFSSSAANLTGKGYDSAHGWGLRLGWLSKITDAVTVGAAYSTKVRMSRFDKYSGLFAQQGDFDMPENFNIGVSFKATPSVTIAADYQRINYAGVKSVSNLSDYGLGFAGVPNSLGGENGRGFGWSSVDVFKLGVEYQYSGNLILRAGYNHTDNPIQARDVTFNIIAPGVVQDHLTLGATYKLSGDSELTFAYMHAFKNSVTGASLYNRFLPGPAGQETIKMHQNSLGIAYGLKFN
ncbi:MAG: outer membrane protein transport protein [Rhodocyclaceae bacterium]|nr:outer membrane protein transport protein [Rhodocyclaceae bacterium]